MYWSVMLVAAWVGGADAVTDVAHSPEKSFTSYTKAWHAAKDQKRPMLVILNPAESAEGTSAIDGQKLLAAEKVAPHLENYVVAVIDTGTEHGKQVNELFGSKALPRVVVIDKEQRLQIFGTSGNITESRLAEVLVEYREGAPKTKVSTSVIQASGTTYFQGTVPGDCPSCRKNWQF